jgi:rare lipoprotein A
LGKTYYVKNSAIGFDERGIASWYGTKFNGQYTSTRQRYNLYAMTAAMKTIPIPTFVEVTNLQNGRHVIVEVNDRGPFDANRLIDLSYAAAGKLDMLQKGTALVEVKTINPTVWNGDANEQLQKQAPELKHPGQPELYIQVGAYSNELNAEKVLAEMRHDILQPSRIETSQTSTHPVYRVQVGPLKSIDISDLVAKRLRHIGYENTMAIVE